MSKKSILEFLLITITILQITACAAIFAPLEKQNPDLSKIQAGAPRQIVEAELGLPIADFRASPDSGADRKAVYRFVIREKPTEKPGTYDSVVNRMTGIEGRQLYVFYDRQSRVIRSQEAPLRAATH